MTKIVAIILSLCLGMGQAFAKETSPKPTVAVVPVIASAETTAQWDISKELTESLKRRLEKRGKIVLYPEKLLEQSMKKWKSNHDPFTPDIEWMGRAFEHPVCAVFLELIEDVETPTVPASCPERPVEKCDATRNISMRVRAVDLTDKNPRIILQEIVHQSHPVPAPFNQYQFHPVTWTDPAFPISPIGLAHAALIQQLVDQIEDYVLQVR